MAIGAGPFAVRQDQSCAHIGSSLHDFYYFAYLQVPCWLLNRWGGCHPEGLLLPITALHDCRPTPSSHQTDLGCAHVGSVCLLIVQCIACLQAHLKLMETSDENKAALMMGMTYLLNISFVESDEVLKICLDYWNVFVADVYSTLHSETSLQFFHQQQASDVKDWCLLFTCILQIFLAQAGLCRLSKQY